MPELAVERSSPVIRLGINVPNFGPQTDARALLSWTRFAESNGFAAIVLSDHVAPTSEVTEVYPPPFYDPLTVIAWLAGSRRTCCSPRRSWWCLTGTRC